VREKLRLGSTWCGVWRRNLRIVFAAGIGEFVGSFGGNK
jgi:hypothetical protein